MVLEKILSKGSSLIELVIVGIWKIQVRNDFDYHNNNIFPFTMMRS